MQVNILEARNQLSRLIKAVQAGEEVIIANRGEPVARLVAATPIGAAAERGSAAAILDFLANHPLPADRRRSHADIEADIEAERASWD